MEAILNVIAENFWIFLLIVAMISFRYFRICGMILLGTMVIWGYVPWVFITVLIMSIIIVLFAEYRYQEEDKLKKKNKRIDPDYD